MRPYALVYLYRSRLRVHFAQELLAGLGVAIAVALVFATMVASGSVAGSTGEVAHAVVGPATLQLAARDSAGFDEAMLARVEALPGVKQAAPLLEQSATIVGPNGRELPVDLAGTDVSLVILDGLAHKLPRVAQTPGAIGLSYRSAQQAGFSIARTATGVAAGMRPHVLLRLRGRTYRPPVSAMLGPAQFGALSGAQVAVMPLESLQRISGLDGRITRVLVQPSPGRQAQVRAELQRLAAGTLTVAPADEDVALLRQALKPSNQASAFFAAISALLGFLFAFNALLLTVPERRRAIADLRLIGTKRTAIIQMVLFQALCLGLGASLVGLLVGYVLSTDVFHQSTGYLAEAFTLGTGTVIGVAPILIAFIGGVLASCLASAVPLLDLRHDAAPDAAQRGNGAGANALGGQIQRRLALGSGVLLGLATVLFVSAPSLALLACGLLALATVLIVPLVFAAVLAGARALAERFQRWTALPVALTSLRSTTVRSLALAATGAVALFGGVALGGGRNDLLRGIDGFARSYAADASIWVTNPGDNQAAIEFRSGADAARIARIPGVARVESFQGGFLTLAGRRVWIIARPRGAARQVLDSQITAGSAGLALARLAQGGWIVVSKQIAQQQHTGVGGLLSLPTPSGLARLRIAATTTNLAWSPGVIFIDSADYSRLWRTASPTALAVQLAPGASAAAVQAAIGRRLGPASGVEALGAHTLEARIGALTGEGLGQLGTISTLLLIAAVLAMAAALSSAIWERRVSLAGLRLSGVRPRRLRRILLVESALMLGAGCLTGAVAGIYGQLIIDGYLKHVTGFPVAGLGASLRPLEILLAVIAIVLAIVAIPGWFASQVSPTVALNE